MKLSLKIIVVVFILSHPGMKVAAQGIEYIDVYAINFTKTSRFGLEEKDIVLPINYQSRIKAVSKDLSSLLAPYLGLYECAITDSSYESVDLRMVCVIKMNNGVEWTLGFSYMDVMTFAGKKLVPRNDQLLLALSDYIDDKNIKKSIKYDVRIGRD